MDGFAVDIAPLVDQLSIAKLSVFVTIVVFATPALWIRMLLFPMMLAGSSSKLLMESERLSNKTSCATISYKNLCCQ